MMITQIVLGLVLIMFMNATNLTSDCPENYYGNGFYDLLDRGWCHGLKPDTRQP